MEEHPQAREIVETLGKAGFVAYYAGGWVRDLLLQHPSDDIDIATNAPPETVQALFPHTVAVGIAFGIVVVIIDGHQYEVATFRQDLDYLDGRRPSRIEFTTAQEDAKRRDFTINGMFYDPIKNEILDYVDGQKDLKAQLIRAIGNPHERIKEDRLRMIRAIRLSCRFNFRIEEKTQQAILAHSSELFPAVAIERVWQEFVKGNNFGKLYPMIIQLHQFHLLQEIFPSLKNLTLEELKKQMGPTTYYPQAAPVIAHLLTLFPERTLQEELEICHYLKISNIEQKFVTFLHHAKALIQINEPLEKVEWAYFYADKHADTSLQILAAHLPIKEKELFLTKHVNQAANLQKSIDQIRSNDLVLKSHHLMQAGVKPGKKMGELLNEGNRIAINEQIFDPQSIIEKLNLS